MAKAMLQRKAYEGEFVLTHFKTFYKVIVKKKKVVPASRLK